MLFLDDLKINKSKVFLFGIDSDYSFYLIKLFIENEIEINLWDLDSFLLINSKNKEEFKSKYITFLSPEEVNLNDYNYIILSKCISSSCGYCFIFNKEEIKEKLYTDFDILQKIYPDYKFTGIFGNSGHTIVRGIFKYMSNETRLNFIDSKDVLITSFPIIISFEKLKYIRNVNFTTIIIYEYDECYFLDKNNRKYFDKLVLNNNEINIVININNSNLKLLYESLCNNKDFSGKSLPISISKILDNGISYVNGTIYDYYNNNVNYDVMENEFIDNDFTRLAILMVYTYIRKNNLFLKNKNLMECLALYSGEENFFEHIKNIENVGIVNNILANSNYLLQLPFKTYKNIYTILFVNGADFDEKFFSSKSRIVFYVDKNNLLNSKFKNVFSNGKEAFDRLYSLCLLEKKEDKIIILLATTCINENKILFKNDIDSIKNLLKETE